MISTLEDWYEAIYQNKNIDCIYIDIQKAFDSVPHDLLIFKLKKIGIQGNLLKWITNFLDNRTFSVKIDQNYSSHRKITSGVPQGSVLGPLLFNIYINDLPDIIPSEIKIKLSADDVKLYVIYKTNTERTKITTAITNLTQWLTTWGLTIAPNKSFILYLGKNNPKSQYKLCNNTINEVESIRDLGIHIDNKLKFKKHISTIIKNAYLRMHQIFKIIKSRSSKTWITAYKSYVRPLLEYAPEVWNPYLKSDIKRIEKCQKYFTKIVLLKCRLPYISYEKRLEYFQIPSLEIRRKVYDLVLAHKIIHGLTNLNPRTMYTPSTRGG
uniref:Reverse transcriptase domain-containing protein n=1 Tax=Meloidogyne hapla TaxID=6305 RepID=A0A1I8AXC6_MELHA